MPKLTIKGKTAVEIEQERADFLAANSKTLESAYAGIAEYLEAARLSVETFARPAEEGAAASGLEFVTSNVLAFVLSLPEFEQYLQERARARGYSELSNKVVEESLAQFDAAIERAAQQQEVAVRKNALDQAQAELKQAEAQLT